MSGHKVTPATLDLLDLLEVPDQLVALERLDYRVGLESRVCRVGWVCLELRDPLGQLEIEDHLDRLVQLDCRDTQDFQVRKDLKDLLVGDLYIALSRCESILTHYLNFNVYC